MSLNTDNLHRCIETLESSLQFLDQHALDSIEYEIYRNAVVKGFELTLETAGKLLRKALKPYFATSKQADRLVFKDIFRTASKHSILNVEEVSRWFSYRDNRNNTAHDYGIGFAEETLKLMPQFIFDAKHLRVQLDHEFTKAK
jgi:nucleotidyltransferase substrate binding protein (TIGR01987 family)